MPAKVMTACGVDQKSSCAGRGQDIISTSELDSLKVDGRDRSVADFSGFQRVVQRAILHVQSSGREEVTGANVLVALLQRARELRGLFPAAAGHEPPGCGQLHQPWRR